ncbi:MAG: DUF2304 domain-containing protein [Magnetococcales bacterium]|nr:DUF2304 domain-containing protein [Magnetococcales bacterium]
MTLKQSIMIFLMGVLFFIGVVSLVRNHHFREKYSLLWIFISLVFLSVPFFDNFYHEIGEIIGISNLTSFLSLFAFLTLFVLMVQMTIALTTAFHQRKSITQNFALLECRVVELEKRLSEYEASNGMCALENQDAEDIGKDG